MVNGTRVIIVNSDADYAVELRSDLLSVDGVTIVAEMNDPTYLASVIEEFSAEVVVVNLDPDPQGLLALARQITTKYPNLAMFAVSKNDDSQFILAAVRAGMREFIVRPADREQLAESLARVTGQGQGEAKRGKLICVVASSGGSGSTTLATNLACELATLSRQKAVLVDLDFLSGNVASLLDISPQFSIADLCGTNEAIDESMVEKALVRHNSGLYVLTSPNQFITAHQLTLERSAVVINMLTDHFDYVICDGITRSDAANHVLLDMTDGILLVFQMLINSIRNADRFLQKLTSEGYNPDRVDLVINRYAKDSSFLQPEDAEEKLGRKINWIVPGDWKTVSNAANLGQPVSVYNPKSKVSEAIRKMAARIHDPENHLKTGESAETQQEAGGFWKKVLGR